MDNRKILKWFEMLLSFFILTSPLITQSYAGTDQQATGLKDIIRLHEHNENDQSLGLLLGTIPQDVDINSVIEINISAEKLPHDIYYKSKSPLRPEQQALLEAANRLQASADTLIQGLRLAAELETNDRGTKEFKNKASELQKHYKDSARVLIDYSNFITQQNIGTLAQRKTTFKQSLNYAAQEGKWEAVISAEIQWIIQELEKTGQDIIRESDPVALNLVAYHISNDKKTFIHLEHYDTLEQEVPQSIDKLNVVPSPEQAAKLREAYTKTKEIADKLNEIENRREQLKESLNIILKQHGIDLTELRDATKELQQELDKLTAFDWQAKLKAIQDRIDVALAGNPATAQKQKLQAINIRLQNMKVLWSALESKVANIKQLISAFSPRLDKAAIRGKDDPVAALLALMGQISSAQNAFDSIVQAINTLHVDAQAFAENTINLTNELTNLLEAINSKDIDAPTRAELKAIVSESFQPTITPVKVAAQRMYAAAADVLSHINNIKGEAKNNLNAYVATEIAPPDTTSFVPLIHAKNTWLDLRGVENRKDGSTVVIQASLYQLKQKSEKFIPSKLIDRETQTLRMLRYGYYGEYSVGLAYVFAENVIANQTAQHRGFAPQVSWVLRHRSWRESTESAHYVKKWYEYIGYGIHTVALDSNNDNQTEIGLGLTLSFMDDMFQLGYGKNLSTDRTYSFIATRLFNF